MLENSRLSRDIVGLLPDPCQEVFLGLTGREFGEHVVAAVAARVRC